MLREFLLELAMSSLIGIALVLSSCFKDICVSVKYSDIWAKAFYWISIITVIVMLLVNILVFSEFKSTKSGYLKMCFCAVFPLMLIVWVASKIMPRR